MKRNSEPIQTVVGQAKNPKTSDSHTRGQQARSHCCKYGKLHCGVCRATGSSCFRCRKTSHMSKD